MCLLLREERGKEGEEKGGLLCESGGIDVPDQNKMLVKNSY